MKPYPAPWGKPLIVISALATVLCLGLTVFEWSTVTRPPLGLPAFWLGCLPLALVLSCALFTIRGYALTPDTLVIRRLFWSTRVPLAELQSAEYLPGAMRGSIRTFGNGGFFSVTGLYWSRLLGSYRAFVTDLQRTVVLRFPGRTLVLSPESPEDFVRVVSEGRGEEGGRRQFRLDPGGGGGQDRRRRPWFLRKQLSSPSMKTLSVAAVLVLAGFSTALSDEFPEVGKSYAVDYAVELVSNPPREFKIISKGSGSWYLIEYVILPLRRSNDPAPAPAPTAARKWINFDHILIAEER